MDLLTGIHIQVGLLGEFPDWVRLFLVLYSQVEPLVRFCNHFWLGKVTGCVLPGWYHWLDSEIGQGYGQSSEIS